VRLGALVTGNTYRNPALLAKIVTTLDVVSGGRAQLGIGAGWFELEHDAFGYEFGTFTDRFEKLEEALQIIVPMLRGEPASLGGKHYRVVDAVNSPPPVGRVPVMIGGGGERKTLRMVAQYADESNISCDRSDVPRKLDALAGHCERLGRDRSEIVVTWQTRALVAPTMEQAEADLAAFLSTRGTNWSSLGPQEQAGLRNMFAMGDPDTVGERFANDLAELGIDGFTVNMVANGHIPDRVELLGQTLSKLL
jgi:alkanesulfonate monooxygenase SsuD/methylene tetrahydromethanopterin reductase-like flavin-dependent oxidoreductase (luciferase family)